MSGDSETIEDLRRLSTIFGHVEKLMTVAASLHRKFLHAPSIAEAIFSDYHKFHSRKMGTSLNGEDDKTVRMPLLVDLIMILVNTFFFFLWADKRPPS